MSFQAGFDKNATWTPDTDGGATTLCITGWTVDDGGDIIDVTSTCHAGKQAFIAGIQRMNGTINAFLDSDTLPSAVGIKFGAKGNLLVKAATSSFAIHIIIEKVSYQCEVNGAVKFTFSYKSDALLSSGAITAGSISYPG